MILKTSCVNLYYEKHGEGAPIILLHGNGEDHSIFNKTIDILKKHFSVYAVDTRGHGKSSAVSELHYYDMADDIYEFICRLNIEKPIIYGFSDGGITALITAIKYPDLVSKIIVSGVNTKPGGLKWVHLAAYRISYFFTKSDRVKMMLTEPDITDEMLKKIKIPTVITAGSNDMIRQAHIKHIADCIPGSKLTVFQGELHGSYVINSRKIADYIINECT